MPLRSAARALFVLALALAAAEAAERPPVRAVDPTRGSPGPGPTAASPPRSSRRGRRPGSGRERAGGALDPESQFEVWAEARSEGTLRFRNCGVFGERTDEIAARLDTCARGAKVLLLQGGINDIAQLRRVRTAARNLRATVRAGRARGLRVLVAEVLPWNNGYPMTARRIRRLNGAISALAREEGAELLPFYAKLEDPSRPGRMKREWTVDGDHPSVEGYRLLGELVAERLKR